MFTFEASTANFTGDIYILYNVYLKHRIRTAYTVAKDKHNNINVFTRVLLFVYYDKKNYV
jgi:hypothetical protein